MGKKSKYKNPKIYHRSARMCWFVFLLSSLPFSVVFCFMSNVLIKAALFFLLLEFMVFNSGGDKVVLNHITRKFMAW